MPIHTCKASYVATMMIMTNLKKLLRSNKVVHDVTKILTGSAIAQFFNFAALPLLAKVYTPEDIAKIGLAFSFINFLTVLSFLRFELAIISTKDESDVKRIFHLCLILMLITIPIFSMVLYGLISSNSYGFGYFNGLLKITLIILTLMFAAFVLVFRNAAIFFQQYTWVSTGTVIQQISTITLQILFGLIHADFISLIAGECLARLATSFYFFKKLSDKLRIKFSKSSLTAIFKKNKKFAIYSTPSSFIDSASGNLMIPFLFSIFTPIEVGCYALIQEISSFPISALSRAIGDVFHERLSKLDQNHRSFFFKFSKYLFLIAFIYCCTLFVFYNFFFSHFFSSKWSISIKLGIITIPWFYLQMSVGTLSRALTVFNKQDLKFYYDITLIAFTFVVFLITKTYHLDIFQFFMLQTLSKSLLYILYFFIICKSVPVNITNPQKT